jgi:hypothetical protein
MSRADPAMDIYDALHAYLAQCMDGERSEGNE